MANADTDTDPDGATARLEQALERIALAAAQRPDPLANPPPSGGYSPDTALVAARLDAVIAELRGALATG